MKRYLLLLICILGIIAYLSSMPYEKQTIIPYLHQFLASQPFKEQLSVLEFSYWGRTISVEQSGYFHFIEFLFRKSLHFFGYGLVGVTLFLFFRKIHWHFPSFFAVGSIFFIASLDELRQRFTPGRTGIFQDVVLDTVGAMTCIFITKIILLLFTRTKAE